MPQSLAKVSLHLIFSTKHRKPFLEPPELRDELYAYMATILRDNVDSPAILINGVEDHVHTYRNFRRQPGLTVEDTLRELGINELAELGVEIPLELVTDCVRLCCCSLCLLEDDPSAIEADVLSKDRARFQESGDEEYVAKAHRRGKVGWNVGRRIEVVPHYRRPHMTLVWTGRGRAVPRVVPRRGSVVHRELVGKVPSGFGRARGIGDARTKSARISPWATIVRSARGGRVTKGAEPRSEARDAEPRFRAVCGE